MKNIFQHPPEPATGRKYWRSLEELAETPEFKERLEREFPQGAAEFNGDEVSRRHFLKIMGASTALAGVGLSGCRRGELHLVPFTKSVEWAIPGKPLFYASSMPARDGYIPLIVATHDGRPTKIEGNPLHPISNGATNSFAQASVLDLYDPDRSKVFKSSGEQVDAAQFAANLDQIIKGLEADGGAGLAFLVEENNSPTRERLRAEIERKYPSARWCVYEPLGSDAKTEALNIAYGPGVHVSSAIDKADVILALDSDFLGFPEGTLEDIRAFSSRRRVGKPGDKMNRLYVVENRYTVTGGMADHRLRVPASHIGAFALQLAEQVAALTSDSGLAKLTQSIQKPAVPVKFTDKWVEETAKDLVAAKGASLVLAGPRQPVAVQLLVQSINSALGNLGKTVIGRQQFTKPGISIAELRREIDNKKITTLFILGGNPVYNAPADLNWAKAQASVPNVIRLGLHEDETSKVAKWHVPAAHYLEAWGDGRTADGAYVSVQPMILPLYGGWSELDILARLAGLPKPQGPELVQETFRQVGKPGDFNADWNKFLHDGFVAGSNVNGRVLFFMASAAAAQVQEKAALPPVAGPDAIEVVLVADARVDDGRYANNGWLQESPDPITKLTWDNAALISPATAEKLGLDTRPDLGRVEFEVVEVKFDDARRIEIPVLVTPGHADNSLTISLGYGRTMDGMICKGTGVNAYPLRTTAQPYFAVGAKVKPTGAKYRLAVTQGHHNMEGRALVREATMERYQSHPDFAKKMFMDAELPAGGNPSLYTHPPLDAAWQWGMAIDLNTCTGCNACVIACQSENNTPIVGKDQVINGREMHWIRMDRYFASMDAHDPDPEMVMQPMLCQQCENAPCETVCPVNATVHSDDGLNVMAYNRCIGTRYCANNCPFKVRRFNFFDYGQRPIQHIKHGPLEAQGLYFGPLTKKGSPETIKMQRNPNVTVRMRGVMEKCSFCVQRIQEAKIAAKVKAGGTDEVVIPTDSFQSACQQACPSEAIVFGNLSDPDSKVVKLKAQEKNYRLLEYLNVSTRVSYLARIRNPNMHMPDAKKVAAFQFEEEHAAPKHEQAAPAHGGAS